MGKNTPYRKGANKGKPKFRQPGQPMFRDKKLDFSVLDDRRTRSSEGERRMYESEKAVSFETSRRYNGNHPGKPADYVKATPKHGVSGKSRRYN